MMTLPVPQGTASRSIRKITLLLIVFALAAVGAISGGALVVYLKTQHLVETRDSIDDTQAILTTLQSQAQRLDRVDSNVQLFIATGNELNIRNAHAAVGGLRVGIVRLRDLVRDNPSQSRHVEEMEQTIDGLSQSIDTVAAKRTTSDLAQRASQNLVGTMQEEERHLLQQRTDEAHNSLSRSLLTGAGYLIFSILIVCVLFAFLLRDTVERNRYETLVSTTNRELTKTVEEQVKLAREAGLLIVARDDLQLCVSSKQAHEAMVRHFELLMPESRGATLTINNSRRMIEIAASWNDPTTLADGFELDACCGLRAGRTRWRSPGLSEVNCTHFYGTAPEYYVCMPLAAHGETLGFIYLECTSAAMAAEVNSKMFVLNEMVELASMTIASLNLKSKLESQSIRDGLTSLFNRRYMESALERELHRANRRKTTLALLMIDVDHFKMFNDTFGHDAGDAVLREVAECLRQKTRAEDVVCRFGGEEFIMILPEIAVATAVERAEAIRKSINNIQIRFRGDLLRKVSVSVGISFHPDAESSEILMQEADKALYRAKAMGRDQVQVSNIYALA